MINYFIFVFNEKNYENEDSLGWTFHFPRNNIGEFKIIDDNAKKSGNIVDRVNIQDKIIWTISGNSTRKDKKTFWGYGEVVGKNTKMRDWPVKSIEFEKKFKTDIILNKLPKEYLDLYKQITEIINIGFKGTIEIDEFQYNSMQPNIGSLIVFQIVGYLIN